MGASVPTSRTGRSCGSASGRFYFLTEHLPLPPPQHVFQLGLTPERPDLLRQTWLANWGHLQLKEPSLPPDRFALEFRPAAARRQEF